MFLEKSQNLNLEESCQIVENSRNFQTLTDCQKFVLQGLYRQVMKRTNVTISFANIRTSRSTYYLLYDKSHSKTNTTIIPYSILLQILASQAKKQEKQEVLVKKQEKIGIDSKNRNRLKKQEKIGTGHPVGRKFTVFLCFTLYLRAISKYKPPKRLIFGGAF